MADYKKSEIVDTMNNKEVLYLLGKDFDHMSTVDCHGDETEELQVGYVVKGTVAFNKKHFSFVKVGKLSCILPYSEISHDKKPKQLKIGTEIEAVVIRISEEKGVMLSIKRAKQDPWDIIDDRYHVGQRVKAKVTNVTNYGVFFEIEPGLDALLHWLQMGLSKSDKVKDFISVNEELEVEIISIDKDNRRMSLSCDKLKKKD